MDEWVHRREVDRRGKYESMRVWEYGSRSETSNFDFLNNHNENIHKFYITVFLFCYYTITNIDIKTSTVKPVENDA